MNAIATDILKSGIQLDSRAQLRNPILKFFLIFFPILIIIISAFLININLNDTIYSRLILFNLFILIASTIDLRPLGLIRFYRKIFVFTILTILVIINLNGEYIFKPEVNNLLQEVFANIPLIHIFTLRTWVIIDLVYISILAGRNISNRDTLWLGRKLFFGKFFIIYMIMITTFNTISSVLPKYVLENMKTARIKYRLVREPSILKRYSVFLRTFVHALLIDIERGGDLIKNLTIQRGFFRLKYYDPHTFHFGKADAISLSFIILGVIVAWIFPALRIPNAVESALYFLSSLIK